MSPRPDTDRQAVLEAIQNVREDEGWPMGGCDCQECAEGLLDALEARGFAIVRTEPSPADVERIWARMEQLGMSTKRSSE